MFLPLPPQHCLSQRLYFPNEYCRLVGHIGKKQVEWRHTWECMHDPWADYLHAPGARRRLQLAPVAEVDGVESWVVAYYLPQVIVLCLVQELSETRGVMKP